MAISQDQITSGVNTFNNFETIRNLTAEENHNKSALFGKEFLQNQLYYREKPQSLRIRLQYTFEYLKSLVKNDSTTRGNEVLSEKG